MVERHFDDEIKSVNTDLLKMAAMVEEAIFKSVEALKNRDEDLAEKVIQDDTRIDEMENLIEEKFIDLLALRQPMAIDLRQITTGMKINAELERIADLTVNISQRVKALSGQQPLKPLIDIPKLSEIARKMVKSAIDSYVNRDESLAKEVILADPEANKIRNAVQSELLHDFLEKDPSSATRAVALLLIARHLERICDHATYISEDVIYMVRATVVRHHKERLDKKI
ncbi:MAG: phosphate signaling complex protein PhoU [Candidatus Omnitrophica bacterium]|nr:phosphate signaling complex protein PhoU [Candidatus Omnitrophota bacterium]